MITNMGQHAGSALPSTSMNEIARTWCAKSNGSDKSSGNNTSSSSDDAGGGRDGCRLRYPQGSIDELAVAVGTRGSFDELALVVKTQGSLFKSLAFAVCNGADSGRSAQKLFSLLLHVRLGKNPPLEKLLVTPSGPCLVAVLPSPQLFWELWQ